MNSSNPAGWRSALIGSAVLVALGTRIAAQVPDVPVAGVAAPKANAAKSDRTSREPATEGHKSRVPWTTSKVQGFPDPPPPLKLVPAFSNLQIPQLIALNRIPDSDWILAVDHETGYGGPSRVVQFRDQPDVDRSELLLERPEIIYGLAFHPDFASNRLVFVGCNGRSEALDATATRVLRFHVEGEGPFHVDPDSLAVIIEWKSNGHNGGDLAFGQDGMLYVSAGDGTSDSDQDRQGQNLSTLNGSLLRIDVDRRDPGKMYRIPADNPFVDTPRAAGEIWAYGLRNPWRVTYDRESDQLWVGNNGQDLWESIYLIQKGANYGWSITEANHPFHTHQDPGPVPISPATFEHHHSQARSLTGGHVYRGSEFPELLGAYIYGDYSTGNIWAIRHNGQEIVFQKRIARSSAQISGFGVDSHQEMLIADHAGTIFRFGRNDAQQTQAFPQALSQTGLFADTANETPAAGLIPYSVNSPLWSDGAIKRRWMAIPGMATIEFKPRGAWGFPDGSVLVKSFAFPTAEPGAYRRVETRLMHKQDGEWYGYSYRWQADQSDAFLVNGEGLAEDLDWVEEAGERVSVRWSYPSRSECMVCHSRAAGFVLGLSTEQIHNSQTSTNQATRREQLTALEQIGLFGDDSRPSALKEIPALVDPSDATLGLAQRARSYLHSNCASCHVNAGGGNSRIVLDFFTPLDKMQVVGETPLHSSLGMQDARLIAPGDPTNSVLFARLSRRGEGQMPPLATHRVDEQALELMRQWINAMPDRSITQR